MTRTKTLVIIGCFMLALAVLAALELRSGESVLAEGQVVTGALSKDTSIPPVAIQSNEKESSPLTGALLPLDNGTLRTSSTEKPSARVDEASSPASFESTSSASLTSLPQTVVTPALQALPATPVLEVNGKINSQPETPVADVPAVKPTAEASSKVATHGKPVDKTEDPKASKPANNGEAAKLTSHSVPSKTTDAPKISTPASKTPAITAPAESASTAKGPKSKPITTAAPEKLLPGEKAIVWTHFEVEAKQAVFRFTGASAIEGKAFVLTSPDRYVVDLKGSWAFDLPKVPTNAFVKSIRAGRQEANTRLVFDLVKPLGNAQLVKVNKETLEIRLR